MQKYFFFKMTDLAVEIIYGTDVVHEETQNEGV